MDSTVTIRLASVVGGDVALLRPFLEHYSALGAEHLSIVRHVDPAGHDDVSDSVEVMAAAGLSFASTVHAPWDEGLNRRLIQGLMQRHPEDWWIVADLDEFQVYDRDLRSVIAHCEERGHDYVEGGFLDRVNQDGRLTGPDPSTVDTLWREYPLAGVLSSRLMDARPTKVTLARGSVVLDYGQHRALTGSAVPPDEIYAQVHHFKWTESLASRLERRVQAYTSGEWDLIHAIVPLESQRFLDHLAAQGGRIDVADPRFHFEPAARGYRECHPWEEAMSDARLKHAEDDVVKRERFATRSAAGEPYFV
jgi:hypothetical protein